MSNNVDEATQPQLVLVGGKLDLSIERLSAPATEAMIDAFAERNEVDLPEDYRRFLIAYNGGRPKSNRCEVSIVNEAIIVDLLFGLTESRGCDIETFNAEYRDQLAPGFTIVGSDPGGAFFILGTTPPNVGVFFWDHQHFFDKSSDENGNTYLIAESFTEWIESLRDSAD